VARELTVKRIPSTFVENGTDPGNFGAVCSTTFRRFTTEVFMGLNLPKTAVSDTWLGLSVRARVFRRLAASHYDLKNFVSHLDGPYAL
jgi:hypothetical protein